MQTHPVAAAVTSSFLFAAMQIKNTATSGKNM